VNRDSTGWEETAPFDIELLKRTTPPSKGDNMVNSDDLQQQVQILAERLLAGDKTTWEELYPLLFRVSYAVIVRIVHDKVESEDLAQETVLKVLRKIGKYNPAKGSFLKWCIKIAVHSALDFLRKKRPRLFSSLSPEDSEYASLEDLPDDSSAQKGVFPHEMLDAIRDCIAGLPPHLRMVIEMRLHGRTLKEIAETLEIADGLKIAIGTVGSRIARAKAQLLKCLQSKLPDYP